MAFSTKVSFKFLNQRLQIISNRFVTSPDSQFGENRRAAFTLPVPTLRILAGLATRRALPLSVLQNVSEVFSVMLLQTAGTELTLKAVTFPGLVGFSGSTNGLRFGTLLSAMVAAGFT
jgi:hypothetical protein